MKVLGPKAKRAAMERISDGAGMVLVGPPAKANVSAPKAATMSLSTPIVSSQDGPRMAGIANFGGKKATPFGKGGKRAIAKKAVAAAKKGKKSRASADLANNWGPWDALHGGHGFGRSRSGPPQVKAKAATLGPGSYGIKSDRNSSVGVTNISHTRAGESESRVIGSVQTHPKGGYQAAYKGGKMKRYASKSQAISAVIRQHRADVAGDDAAYAANARDHKIDEGFSNNWAAWDAAHSGNKVFKVEHRSDGHHVTQGGETVAGPFKDVNHAYDEATKRERALRGPLPHSKDFSNTVTGGTPVVTGPKATVKGGKPVLSKKPVSYTIKPGDTLSALARRYGTTVAALAAANGIKNPNLIRAGAHLTIHPGSKPAAPAARSGSGKANNWSAFDEQRRNGGSRRATAKKAVAKHRARKVAAAKASVAPRHGETLSM